MDQRRKLGTPEGIGHDHQGGTTKEPVPTTGRAQRQDRPAGTGTAVSQRREADTISKLANAIKKMETEVGLADITSVFADLLKWLRTYDAEQAKQVCPLLDAFVKSKLA